jgi:hypothetical protein
MCLSSCDSSTDVTTSPCPFNVFRKNLQAGMSSCIVLACFLSFSSCLIDLPGLGAGISGVGLTCCLTSSLFSFVLVLCGVDLFGFIRG